MTTVMELTDTWLSDFEALEASKALDGPSWLAPIRKAAIASFGETGFPTVKDEEWRFTNPAPVTSRRFARPAEAAPDVPAGALARFLFGEVKCPRLAFVNGRFSRALSSLDRLPDGVRVVSLAEVLRSEPDAVEPHLARHTNHRHGAFVALNTAFMEDGAVVLVSRGRVIEQPIHVVFIAAGEGEFATHPRNLFVAGDNSQATIVESYVGLDNGHVYLTNAVTEMVAGENAILDHYRIEQESESAFHMARFQTTQGRSSAITSHSLAFGGALVRNDVNAVLDGEGADCTLNGLYLLHGEQLVDNHLRVEHAKPHCNSWEYYKGILDEKSRGVFTGRILVHKDAQKTDAKQTNMNLLLSPDALVDTKPQLEIFADDVKCTHGATIGQMNDDALFYLRARGIRESAARDLLVYAFASEIIEQIRLEPIQHQLETLLYARLSGTSSGKEKQ